VQLASVSDSSVSLLRCAFADEPRINKRVAGRIKLLEIAHHLQRDASALVGRATGRQRHHITIAQQPVERHPGRAIPHARSRSGTRARRLRKRVEKAADRPWLWFPLSSFKRTALKVCPINGRKWRGSGRRCYRHMMRQRTKRRARGRPMLTMPRSLGARQESSPQKHPQRFARPTSQN
jgi:hypothetical protein